MLFFPLVLLFLCFLWKLLLICSFWNRLSFKCSRPVVKLIWANLLFIWYFCKFKWFNFYLFTCFRTLFVLFLICRLWNWIGFKLLYMYYLLDFNRFFFQKVQFCLKGYCKLTFHKIVKLLINFSYISLIFLFFNNFFSPLILCI